MMYTELRAASAFSFLDGASLPETLAATASELNLPSIALLDRDGVFGAPRFHLAAVKTGVQARIGAEISTALMCCEKTSSRMPTQRTGHIAVLAATRQGYQNLCRLLTKM